MSKRAGESTNKQGIILITVIVVLVFLASLGLSLIAFMLSHQTYVQMQSDRIGALYLAEAAISKSIYELRTNTDPDDNGVGNIRPTKVGSGLCWAKHHYATYTITATGEINRVKRTVQIKYSAL